MTKSDSILNTLLFIEIDARRYATIRICLGMAILMWSINLLSLSDVHLSSAGWLNWSSAIRVSVDDPWNYLSFHQSPETTVDELLVISVIAVSFTIGFKTKICNFALLLALASFRAKNSVFTYGGDDLIRILLFCLLWSPSGERWSMDQRKDKIGRARCSIWPARLIQFQICLIYFIAGITKLFGTDWIEGRALWYLIQDVNLNNFALRGTVESSSILIWSLRAASRLTPIFETLFPIFLCLQKTRHFMIGLGVVFHLLIAVFFKTELFSVAMIIGYIAFFDPSEFSAFSLSYLKPSESAGNSHHS